MFPFLNSKITLKFHNHTAVVNCLYNLTTPVKVNTAASHPLDNLEKSTQKQPNHKSTQIYSGLSLVPRPKRTKIYHLQLQHLVPKVGLTGWQVSLSDRPGDLRHVTPRWFEGLRLCPKWLAYLEFNPHASVSLLVAMNESTESTNFSSSFTDVC